MTSKPAIPWWIGALVGALLSLGSTLYMTAGNNDRVDAQRLSTVETKQTDFEKRQDRMEAKIDKLVEWALGKQ